MAWAWTGDGVMYSSSLRTCFRGAAKAIASNVAVIFLKMSALPETAAGEVDECRVNLLQSLIDEDRKKRAANAAAGGNVSACRFHRQELGNGNAFPTFRRRWPGRLA